MRSLPSSLFRALFPRLAQGMARRRAAWDARFKARRRQARFVRPRIEGLEDRIVPDAYVFAVNNIPSSGSWTNPALWTDMNTGNPGVPGGGDSADIPAGASCTLSVTASVNAVTVEGTLTVGGPSGTTSGTLGTNTMTITAGGSAAGTVNIGDPGTGMGGEVDVAVKMTNSGFLTVGGAGGSSGALKVYSLADGSDTINAKGAIEVKHDASFLGTTTIDGGFIQADNIDANTGASVVIGGGGATITNGPLSGNLTAEVNASFTFAGPVTFGTGGTIGGGKYYLDSTLTVDEPLVVSNAEFVLQNDGTSTLGTITGTGSIDWSNHPFEWQGGTIGGLTHGGFTIEGQADLFTDGSSGKTLSTTMTDVGPSTVNFGGAGVLLITAGAALVNEAPSVAPMEFSTSVSGPGTLTNTGYIHIIMTSGGPSSVIFACVLDNTAAGVIDDEMGAGTLTLSDISGGSVLDGNIDMNSNDLIISGVYGTDSPLSVSGRGGTTVSGTLTIDSGASADISALILSSGGTVTGGGDLLLHGDCQWLSGTISGGGQLIVWGDGTLTLSGTGTESRYMDNKGHVVWLSGSNITFSSGTTVHNDLSALFDYKNNQHGVIPTFINDGVLEVEAGDMLTVNTFTQSSGGTLQSDLASAASYGSLYVTGLATLDGTLAGNAVNGYQPSSGTTYGVLNFGSSSGQFATVNPQGWSAEYNPTSVDLVAG